MQYSKKQVSESIDVHFTSPSNLYEGSMCMCCTVCCPWLYCRHMLRCAHTNLLALPLRTVTHKIACTQIVSMHLAEADSPLVVPATVGCTTDTAGSGVRTWYPCSFSASRAPDDSRRRMPSSADSGTFDCASVTTKSIVILEREV